MLGVRSVTRVTCVLAIGVLAISALARADSPEERQFDFANGLFRKGYFDLAAEQYRQYLQEYPSGQFQQDAWLRLAESEFSQNRYPESLDAYEQYLQRTDPQNPAYKRALARKGELLYRLKRYDEALAVLNPLTYEDTEADIRASCLYFAAKVASDQNDPNRAQSLLKQLIESCSGSPLVPFARYQLASVLASTGQLEQAAIEFAEAANYAQDDSLRIECRFRAAETYDKVGWFDAAVTAYEDLLKQYPDTTYTPQALRGYAWALFHARRYDDALAATDRFLQAYAESPQRFDIAYLRGNCLQLKGLLQEAMKEYEALRKDAANTEFGARAHYRMAWVLFQMGNQEEANREVDTFLSKYTDSPIRGDVLFLRGALLLAKGNFQDAYEEFHLVAENYPTSEFAPDALFKAGECLAQLGRIEEAGKAFERFVQLYPEHPLTEQAVLRVGDAQFLTASFEGATAKYRAILERNPDPTTEQEILYRLAVTYHNMQNYAESAATFRKLVEKFPQSPRVAEARFRIGDYLLRDAAKAIEAIPEFEASLAAEAKGAFSGRATKGLALARYETKDYDGAAETFLKLIRDFPDVRLNEKTYAWLGQRFYEQQRWREAAETFDAMARALPDYPKPERIKLKIAECTQKAGDVEKALQLYDAVAQTAPQSTESVEARWNMAQIHESRGETDKAIALYEAAANADTSEKAARARFRLGELFEQRGDFDAAARHYMRIAILMLHEELSPESLLRAARCFEQAGKIDQAKKAYQELIAEFPQSAQAAQATESLQRLG